jgi:hypothetical protein
MNLKGLQFADTAEIQNAVTDVLKKVQKRKFRLLFRKCTTAQKTVNMPMELILIKNKYFCLPHVSFGF